MRLSLSATRLAAMAFRRVEFHLKVGPAGRRDQGASGHRRLLQAWPASSLRPSGRLQRLPTGPSPVSRARVDLAQRVDAAEAPAPRMDSISTRSCSSGFSQCALAALNDPVQPSWGPGPSVSACRAARRQSRPTGSLACRRRDGQLERLGQEAPHRRLDADDGRTATKVTRSAEEGLEANVVVGAGVAPSARPGVVAHDPGVVVDPSPAGAVLQGHFPMLWCTSR